MLTRVPYINMCQGKVRGMQAFVKSTAQLNLNITLLTAALVMVIRALERNLYCTSCWFVAIITMTTLEVHVHGSFRPLLCEHPPSVHSLQLSPLAASR